MMFLKVIFKIIIKKNFLIKIVQIIKVGMKIKKHKFLQQIELLWLHLNKQTNPFSKPTNQLLPMN
jgi:hypothetical protein